MADKQGRHSRTRRTSESTRENTSRSTHKGGYAFFSKWNDKINKATYKNRKTTKASHKDGRGSGNARRARLGGGFAVFALEFEKTKR